MNSRTSSTSRKGHHAAAVLAFAAAVALGVPVRAGEPLKFRHHFVDRDLPGSSWGQTAAADLDRDGRPDLITGRSRGEILWYRLESSGRWTRQRLGEQSPSDVGGAALDVDGDGWVDFITGGPGIATRASHARNPSNGSSSTRISAECMTWS